MKQSYHQLIFLAGWMMLALTGCQPPETGEGGSFFRGQTLTTALSVLPPSGLPATKSSYTGADDRVYNWNLLLFEGGILQAKYYQDSAGDLSLNVMTDRPYRYYALANVGDLTGRFTVGTTTVEEMQALRIDADIAEGLPMAWHSPDAIAFSRRQLASGQKLPVELTRLVGRYDIVVDQTGLSNWSFIATRLILSGVSSVTPFADRSRSTAASAVTDTATAADLAVLNAGGSTSYYPVENCLGNLLAVDESPWNKIPANIPADTYPSYIELSGTLRMTDGSELTRDVTYRFCLGENATDNFDVIRNRTHTVTLQLSDAPITGETHHWKLETGYFTDTRSLAFPDESILLLPGSQVETAIMRTPSGLRYTVEADTALMDAGVALQDHAWGSVMDSDRLTLTAPADAAPATGTLRLKTLDGSKMACITLIVGRIPTSLIVSPSTEQKLLTGGATVTYSFKVTYMGQSGQQSVDPDDVVWTIEDGDIVEYLGNGALRSKTKRGQTRVDFAYTENGTTVTASRSVSTYANLRSIRVEPAEIYLPGCGTESFADSHISRNYAVSNEVQIRVYAKYHDDVEFDVTGAATLTGNNPMYYTQSGDSYRHAANAVVATQGNGNISVYRAYSDGNASVYLGPASNSYRYYMNDLPRLGNAPQTFVAVTYTEGQYNKTAEVKATLQNPALPVSLTITPSEAVAFSGGFRTRFSAICTLADGSEKDVSNDAAWSADGLVTSDGGGRFTTGSETGTTQVYASYSDKGVTLQANASLLVRERAVTKVELCVLEGDYWIWDRSQVELGSSQTWRIRVIYEDGDIQFYFSGFSLTSSDPSVVATSGFSSQAVGPGTAVVTASYAGQTSSSVTIDVVETN